MRLLRFNPLAAALIGTAALGSISFAPSRGSFARTSETKHKPKPAAPIPRVHKLDRHDHDRIAAAQAKRDRKAAKRAGVS
jgi:hypothetical protein